MDADMPPDVDEMVGGMKETVDVKPSGVAAGVPAEHDAEPAPPQAETPPESPPSPSSHSPAAAASSSHFDDTEGSGDTAGRTADRRREVVAGMNMYGAHASGVTFVSEHMTINTPVTGGDYSAGEAREARLSFETEAVGRIFLSYRRTDAPHAAGRLFEHFTSRFGVDKVFMDVNSIDAGLDFVDIIEAAVDACNVLLAVIGPHWLDAVDERGRRRLDDPDDFVSLEITTALRRGIRVIPVLIDGTPLPQQDELPRHLAALSRRQSVGLNHATFGAGITSLMTAVEQAIRTP